MNSKHKKNSNSAAHKDAANENLDYTFETSDMEQTKQELDRSQLKDQAGEEIVSAILRVSKAKYVPAGIEVRSWIDDYIYTANMQERDIKNLEQDPLVISISRAERLRTFEEG